MDFLYSPQNRAERLIAAGRVVLAASSLFAVWFDPSEPAKNAAVAYTLLALYLAYSLVIAIIVSRSDSPAGRQRMFSHAFDFVFFSLFIYFTAGPASPFTPYFTFSLVCATLRWQWRGVLWTAIASLLVFLAFGVLFALVLHDPAFELTSFVIRGVYLSVTAVLLAYLGIHEGRTRREMAALAAWPHIAPGSLEEALHDLLGQAARTLDAKHLLFAWQEPDEPWLFLASWRRGEVELEREPPTAFEPLVAAPLASSSFLVPDLRAEEPESLVRSPEGFRRFRGAPIHAGLRDRFALRSLLALPLRGESFEGRLFVIDSAGMTSDDLVLGEIVAELMRARLDLFHLTRRLQESAATEERIRLARDLHDGLLQSLTGIGLRLAALKRRLASPLGADPAAEASLAELQNLVALEQKDLRFFIRELKPLPLDEAGVAFDLPARVADLRQRLEVEWGLAVDLRMDGPAGELPEGLAREVYQMAREALVNAVRHGAATRVDLAIETEVGRAVRLSVSDNGRGFPFQGRFSDRELAAANLGPWTLRQRVAALSGSLELESSDQGARLDIRVPAPEAA